MSTLIEHIEKRIYSNKPKPELYGQYSFGRINVDDSNRILGIKQDSENISGGWRFTNETDSSWNHLYTTVERWTDYRYQSIWFDDFPYDFTWVDSTNYGWWCVDNIYTETIITDHVITADWWNCHHPDEPGRDPCECRCSNNEYKKSRSDPFPNDCDSDSNCYNGCVEWCSTWNWTEITYLYDDSIGRVGLNPRNPMQLDRGFPSDWSGPDITLAISKIDDLRPISFVTSTYDTDLQSYYDGDDINSVKLRSLSSAPNNVTFRFDFAENYTNHQYDLVDLTVSPFDFFDYYYFVMDWDWQPSDDYWGPGENFPFTDFEHTHLNLPKTTQELAVSAVEELFVLKNIDEPTTHYYNMPGIKTIKVMFLTTMKNNELYEGDPDTVDDDEIIPPGPDFDMYKFELIKDLFEAAGASNEIPITDNPSQWTDYNDIPPQGGDIPNYTEYENETAIGLSNNLFAYNSGGWYQQMCVYNDFCQTYVADRFLLSDDSALSLCRELNADNLWQGSACWCCAGTEGYGYQNWDNTTVMAATHDARTSWETALTIAGLCLGYNTVPSTNPEGMEIAGGECYHPDHGPGLGHNLLWYNIGSEDENGNWLGITPEPMGEVLIPGSGYYTNNYVTIPWGDYSSDGGRDTDPADEVQAVDWKLMTIKIFLDDEGSVSLADYEDIGGDEYIYLPYPDIINLPVYDEDGNNIHGFSPLGNPYKTSHPIISGLSENSTYVSSLKKVVEQDKFSLGEENEKTLFRRAKDLAPGGSRDEWGKYLGTTDIAQVRMFNNPNFDMALLLGIQTIYDFNSNEIFGEDEEEFHPYDDCDYWYQENIRRCQMSNLNGKLFPEESPVGDIFISEYNQFKDYCLFEINCEKINDKSFNDTSGMGNKGILFGDFSVDKPYPDQEANRDSYIKIPKIGNKKDGAF